MKEDSIERDVNVDLVFIQAKSNSFIFHTNYFIKWPSQTTIKENNCMNYRHIYMLIVEHAKKEELLGLRPMSQRDKKNFPNQYFERHHILPRSLFPLWKDRKSNIVSLTAREHFFCHQLLTKIYPSKEMIFAMLYFQTQVKKVPKNVKLYRLSSKEYERLHGDTFKKAIATAVKKRHTNTKHWTNGKDNKYCVDCPGDGWYLGTTYYKKDVFACRKGRIPWNKGKSTDPKSIKKASETLKAKNALLTKEERKKKYGHSHTAWNKGKTTGKHWFTNGVNSVLSSACPIGYWKGKIISDETKQKISQTQLNRSDEEKAILKEKLSKAHLGQKHTQDWKNNMSELMKQRRSEKQNNWYSEKGKQKIKEAASLRKGKVHWWTNGYENIVQEICPVGFWAGKTSKTDQAIAQNAIDLLA